MATTYGNHAFVLPPNAKLVKAETDRETTIPPRVMERFEGAVPDPEPARALPPEEGARGEKDKKPFEDCDQFQADGGCVPTLHQRYEGGRGDIYRCRTCGRTYSSRRGGILFKSRLSEEVVEDLMRSHQEGEPIRRVARRLKLNRGTVRRYFRLLDDE